MVTDRNPYVSIQHRGLEYLEHTVVSSVRTSLRECQIVPFTTFAPHGLRTPLRDTSTFS